MHFIFNHFSTTILVKSFFNYNFGDWEKYIWKQLITNAFPNKKRKFRKTVFLNYKDSEILLK